MCQKQTAEQHREWSFRSLILVRFNGYPLRWLLFLETFKAAVDSQECLTEIEKFTYLKKQTDMQQIAWVGLALQVETKKKHGIIRKAIW